MPTLSQRSLIAMAGLFGIGCTKTA
ncbi:MAG: IPTL-CTERM sorting domain-containing protein [Candidatus Dadabacteria bacterium]